MANSSDGKAQTSWHEFVIRENNEYQVLGLNGSQLSKLEKMNNCSGEIKFVTFAGPKTRATTIMANKLLKNVSELESDEELTKNSVLIRQGLLRIGNGRGRPVHAGFVLALELFNENDKHFQLLSLCAKVSSTVCVIITNTDKNKIARLEKALKQITDNNTNDSKPTLWITLLMCKPDLENRGFGSNDLATPKSPEVVKQKVDNQNEHCKRLLSILEWSKKRFRIVLFNAKESSESKTGNKQTVKMLRDEISGGPSCAHINNIQAKLKLFGSSVFYNNREVQPLSQENEKTFEMQFRGKLIQEQFKLMKNFLIEKKFTCDELKLNDIFEDANFDREKCIYFAKNLTKFNNRMTWICETISKLSQNNEGVMEEPKIKLGDLNFWNQMSPQDQENLIEGHFVVFHEILFKLAMEYSVSKYKELLEKQTSDVLQLSKETWKTIESKVSNTVCKEVISFFKNWVNVLRISYLIEERLKLEGKISLLVFQNKIEDLKEQRDMGILAGTKLFRKMRNSTNFEVREIASDYNCYLFEMGSNFQSMSSHCNTMFRKSIKRQEKDETDAISFPTHLTDPKERLKEVVGLIRLQLEDNKISGRIDSLVVIEVLIHLENADHILSSDKSLAAIEDQLIVMRDVADSLSVVRSKTAKPGMFECGKCNLCKEPKKGKNDKNQAEKLPKGKPQNILSGKVVSNEVFTFVITEHLTCESRGLIYYIKCAQDGCAKVCYVGETKKTLSNRMSLYSSKIRTKKGSRLIEQHFQQADHSFDDFRVTALFTTNAVSRIRKENQTMYAFKSLKSLGLGGLNNDFSHLAAGLINNPYPNVKNENKNV